jgi:hypothetical protein
MVISILKWVAIAMVLSLFALWLWQGGYWKIANYAQIIPNPLDATSTSGGLYQLPGQPDFFTIDDTTSAPDEMEYGAADYGNASDVLYQSGTYDPNAARSPYAGFIELQIGGADRPDVNGEYVVIRASDFVTLPIPVSGWSLKSAYTGRRAIIPLAASPFYQGVVNTVEPIELSSGESVILSTGVSPVGVSFRETVCTGYLGQTQQFSPALSNSCPRPTDLMPRSNENAARYGASCLDYVERLPQCSFPTIFPSDLSSACRNYLTTTFTYNGCTQVYGSRSGSAMSTWRAYYASGEELWQNEHDSIVLTDEQGRTVASVSY